MKAVRFHRYGDIDVLGVEDVEPRPLGPKDVLVRVGAAGINPGEAKSFVLRPGKNHQLLVPAAIDDPGAISVAYTDNGGKSAITVTSASGPMTYKILSDPTGSGGYVDAGTFTMRGNGTATTESFNRDLGAIVIGEFKPAG